MVKLQLSLILVFFLVKANVAAPSTEARFDHEARSGETQENPLFTYMTKFLTNIKTVVMKKTEDIIDWNLKQFVDEFESHKATLRSYFDDVQSDIQSKLKGTAYYYTLH